MATNPRIPESFEPDRKRPDSPLRTPQPTSGVSGVALAIICAALLLGAILYFMPRAPKATSPPTSADVPLQTTGGALQLSGMKMTPDPTGNALTLEGNIHNVREQTINGAVMHVVFRGTDGSILAERTTPIQVLSPAQGTSSVAQALTDAPLKPNDTRPFRITVDHVPKGWNHEMPEMLITNIASHP